MRKLLDRYLFLLGLGAKDLGDSIKDRVNRGATPPAALKISLTGTRGKVTHVDRYIDLIGELLEFHLPQPIATGIAPTPIGGDQYCVRLWIIRLAHMPPPAPDGFDRTLGGVVIDPHTDPASIVRRIVHTIGTNLAQMLVRKIVCPDSLRLPLGLVVPPPIGKPTH